MKNLSAGVCHIYVRAYIL